MNRPKVVFDLDGVIVDFGLGFSEYLELEPPQGCEMQKTWRFEDSPDYPDLTAHEVEDAWKGIRKSDDFWSELPSALTEADEAAIHRLAEAYDIMYVTDRNVGVDPVGQTVGWLIDQSLPNPYHVLSRRVTNQKKWEVVKTLHPIAMIEDSPKNLPQLVRLNTEPWMLEDIHIFRMVRPYNDCCPGTPVSTVAEFCRAVENLVQ